LKKEQELKERRRRGDKKAGHRITVVPKEGKRDQKKEEKGKKIL